MISSQELPERNLPDQLVNVKPVNWHDPVVEQPCCSHSDPVPAIMAAKQEQVKFLGHLIHVPWKALPQAPVYQRC